MEGDLKLSLEEDRKKCYAFMKPKKTTNKEVPPTMAKKKSSMLKVTKQQSTTSTVGTASAAALRKTSTLKKRASRNARLSKMTVDETESRLTAASNSEVAAVAS